VPWVRHQWNVKVEDKVKDEVEVEDKVGRGDEIDPNLEVKKNS